jgi:hypothetical protein
MVEPPEFADRSPAIQEWHVHVEQGEIARLAAQDRECLDAVRGGDDLVAASGKQMIQTGAHGIIVVHNEDNFAVGSG